MTPDDYTTLYDVIIERTASGVAFKRFRTIDSLLGHVVRHYKKGSSAECRTIFKGRAKTFQVDRGKEVLVIHSYSNAAWYLEEHSKGRLSPIIKENFVRWYNSMPQEAYNLKIDGQDFRVKLKYINKGQINKLWNDLNSSKH